MSDLVIHLFPCFNSTLQGSTKTALVVISLLGFISFDVVYVAAVMNYAAQSEMNIRLIYAIASLIRNKHYKDIDSAIKVHVHVQNLSCENKPSLTKAMSIFTYWYHSAINICMVFIYALYASHYQVTYM